MKDLMFVLLSCERSETILIEFMAIAQAILGPVHTYLEIFFSANIFLRMRKFESFSAVHTYPIVSRNFLICSSAQFFCRRESWNEHAHNSDLGAISFAPAEIFFGITFWGNLGTRLISVTKPSQAFLSPFALSSADCRREV